MKYYLGNNSCHIRCEFIFMPQIRRSNMWEVVIFLSAVLVTTAFCFWSSKYVTA